MCLTLTSPHTTLCRTTGRFWLFSCGACFLPSVMDHWCVDEMAVAAGGLPLTGALMTFCSAAAALVLMCRRNGMAAWPLSSKGCWTSGASRRRSGIFPSSC